MTQSHYQYIKLIIVGIHDNVVLGIIVRRIYLMKGRKDIGGDWEIMNTVYILVIITYIMIYECKTMIRV